MNSRAPILPLFALDLDKMSPELRAVKKAGKEPERGSALEDELYALIQEEKAPKVAEMEKDSNYTRSLADDDWNAPYLLTHSFPFSVGDAFVRERFSQARLEARSIHRDPTGPFTFCWDNVERQILRKGGTPVSGWLVSPSVLAKSGVELEPHCVWRSPEGQLVEVTERVSSWLFAPSPLVQTRMTGVILSGPKEMLEFAALGYKRAGRQSKLIKRTGN